MQDINSALGLNDEQQQYKLSDIEFLSLPRYIFNPDAELDVRFRNIGFESVPRGRLRIVRNHIYKDMADLNETEETLQERVKYAAWIAVEITEAYAECGIVEINCLKGTKSSIVKEVQAIILPEMPLTTQGLLDELREVAAARIDQAEKSHSEEIITLARKALKEMIAATQRGLSYQEKYISDTLAEQAKAIKYGSGKVQFDKRDLGYFTLLGRGVPPDGNEVLKSQLVKKTLEGQTEAAGYNNEVLAEVIALSVTESLKKLLPLLQEDSGKKR